MSSAPARAGTYQGVAIALALTAAIVLTIDASSLFTVLQPSASVVLAVTSALGLLLVAALPDARRGRAGLALAVCLLAVLGFAVDRLVRDGRVAALPGAAEKDAMRELEGRASIIQEQFAALLARAHAPLESSRETLSSFDGSTAGAFALIDDVDRRSRFTRQGGGLALYDAANRAMAWAGDSYPSTPGLLDAVPEGKITFRVVAEPHMARLYALLPIRGYKLVSETTVVSRLDPTIRDRVLPRLAGDDSVDIKLQDFREPETGFANLLARRDDRYPGGASGGRPLLFVGLRAADHTFLGHAKLVGIGQADMRHRLDARHRGAACAILALFLLALSLVVFLPGGRVGAPGAAQLVTRLLMGLGLLWAGRVMLSWFPLETMLPGLDLFDSSQFASAGLFHLLRSPGDLLITTLAFLGSALIASRACGRLAQAARDSGRGRVCSLIGYALLVAIAAGCALYVPSLARELVNNSTMNLLSVARLPFSPATLEMQIAALLVLFSLFLAAQAALHLVGAGDGPLARFARVLPRPGDGMSRWAVGAFVPGMLLAAILYDPLVVPPSLETNERLFEEQLMPMVTAQSENRRAMVSATIDALESMSELPDKIQGPEPSPSSLALDLWLHTPLKDSGYNASLLVLDSDGRTISRFARNLPPVFDKRAEETYTPPGTPTLERVKFLNLNRTIWHADHYVISGDQLLGTVTIHVLDDFDNIPFLVEERPYARALTSQRQRIMTLSPASRGVRYTVYDQHGHPVFWNQREAPPLPQHWTGLLVARGTSQWTDIEEEERPARYLFFSDGDHVFALGFINAAPLERIARGIRLSFVALVAVAALLVPAALVQARGRVGGWWSKIIEALGRTHYRKLLATFTAATLIPLLLLSAIMTGYITRGLDVDIEDRGRQGIESASSLVKTILGTEGKPKPDDDTLYWLSLLVGEDVNLYEHGELIATSRPELFASGLLSPRLDGDVYRRLALDGRRFSMGEESLKGDAYRTITATVVADEGNFEGQLSLPLDAQTAEALVAAREVSDAMIISFAAMVFLMGAVAYVLARRVSRPIRSLREAAARIAGGDFDAVVSDRPRDETGELIASFNSMARAIKEQREDLERRKDYIEKILRNATIGVVSLDEGRRVVTVNPAARVILGLPGLDAGTDLADLVTARGPLAPLAGPLLDPTSPGAAHDVELTIPEPSERTVRARLVPFLEGQGLILLLEDVTETVRSNRLAAWAEMARRIAHEIKNPLTPIQLSAEHIRRVHDERSAEFPFVLEECLRTIMDAVADLRRISAEFSTYARIPVTRKEQADMTRLIADVARPYRTAPPPGIRVEADIPELPRLSVDRSLIARALINLIENALQAMPRGGTLSLRAWADERNLAIEVADTGVGMEPASLARIFEPYFSTKDTGTGLGLAIASKAIEEHGGRIDVTSVAGRGTTMRILLPTSPAAPAALTAEPASGRRHD